MTDLDQHPAFEVTTAQAFYLAERLSAGTFPWVLAITTPYAYPHEKEPFDQQCAQDLHALEVIDPHGNIHPAAQHAIRTTCHSSRRYEWRTIIDKDQILRGVLAHNGDPSHCIAALRYAQMITFTPLEITHSEALVPILTTGLDDQLPAQFPEFTLPMDIGADLDLRIANHADILDSLIELGVPEASANAMTIARSGQHPMTEITAHDAINGARHATDVGVTIINSQIGRILVAPPRGEPREGGSSTFTPGEPFAIAMALRDLTDRLPSGNWFPDESFDI